MVVVMPHIDFRDQHGNHARAYYVRPGNEAVDIAQNGADAVAYQHEYGSNVEMCISLSIRGLWWCAGIAFKVFWLLAVYVVAPLVLFGWTAATAVLVVGQRVFIHPEIIARHRVAARNLALVSLVATGVALLLYFIYPGHGDVFYGVATIGFIAFWCGLWGYATSFAQMDISNSNMDRVSGTGFGLVNLAFIRSHRRPSNLWTAAQDILVVAGITAAIYAIVPLKGSWISQVAGETGLSAAMRASGLGASGGEILLLLLALGVAFFAVSVVWVQHLIHDHATAE
jgi:hypothetical protein